MADILLVEQGSFAGPASAVFSAIEDGRVPGWRIPDGARLAVGTPISMRLDAPDCIGRSHIDLLGRVSHLQPGRRLVVAYHQPWQGSISLTVTDRGPTRTHMRMVVSLGDSAPDWLKRAAGGGYRDPVEEFDPLEPSHAIGLLMSGSGAAGVFAPATENLAQLAVADLNSDGGLDGLPVRLHVGDDATDPATGVSELVRLAKLGCKTVVTNVTSATFARLRPVAARLGVTLIFTPVNEGGASTPTMLRLGERPMGQLGHSVPRLMALTGERRWFLAGNDYCWPRATNRVARRVIRQGGGVVVGEKYERLGSDDFTPLIEAINRSGAELIVSTFVGADEVSFEQQCYAAGLRTRCQTLALALDESTRDYIGPSAAEGLWTSFAYFEELDTDENRGFVTRYRQAFGITAPPVSSISESVYEAIHLYAHAHRRGSDAFESRRWEGVAFDGPRGLVRIAEGATAQQMYLARVKQARFQLEVTI